MVFDTQGNLIFTARSDAVQSGDIYVAPNGVNPEVWYTDISEDGSRVVFASWGGSAYLYGYDE